MKPGMIALTLSTMQLQRLGYSPEKGIDLYFAKKANQLGKPIVSLESIQDQLNMLLTMPNENAFLQYTLLDLENLEHFMNEIITAWKSGDASLLYQILIAPYENIKEYQPFIRKLLYNRNLRMASQIRKFLKSDQTWFVVVGAGHLLGDKGLISLLEKKNYTITQLEHEKRIVDLSTQQMLKSAPNAISVSINASVIQQNSHHPKILWFESVVKRKVEKAAA